MTRKDYFYNGTYRMVAVDPDTEVNYRQFLVTTKYGFSADVYYPVWQDTGLPSDHFVVVPRDEEDGYPLLASAYIGRLVEDTPFDVIDEWLTDLEAELEDYSEKFYDMLANLVELSAVALKAEIELEDNWKEMTAEDCFNLDTLHRGINAYVLDWVPQDENSDLIESVYIMDRVWY